MLRSLGGAKVSIIRRLQDAKPDVNNVRITIEFGHKIFSFTVKQDSESVCNPVLDCVLVCNKNYCIHLLRDMQQVSNSYSIGRRISDIETHPKTEHKHDFSNLRGFCTLHSKNSYTEGIS